MSEPLVGKVAAILDQYRVIINLGSTDGVEKGMKFSIQSEPFDVEDPDSKEVLETLFWRKGTVIVTQVYKKTSLAQTEMKYMMETPFELSSLFRERRKVLNTKPSIKEFSTEVKVGDRVQQVIEEQ